jgi:hypothetical protein
MLQPGRCSSSAMAVANPTMPAPMTQKSAVMASLRR